MLNGQMWLLLYMYTAYVQYEVNSASRDSRCKCVAHAWKTKKIQGMAAAGRNNERHDLVSNWVHEDTNQRFSSHQMMVNANLTLQIASNTRLGLITYLLGIP